MQSNLSIINFASIENELFLGSALTPQVDGVGFLLSNLHGACGTNAVCYSYNPPTFHISLNDNQVKSIVFLHDS